jgi:RNA polymerase sigma-70 factor (ECF subfamily)
MSMPARAEDGANRAGEVVSQLHALHGDALKRYLSRVLRCEVAAQDVAQDAYARLLRYRPNLEPGSSRSYLFRVALNIARSHFSERHVRAEIPSSLDREEELESELPGPDRVAEAREVFGILADEIESLPPRCRQVSLMHRLQGLTHDSIAESLRISRSMVEKHMIKAMDRCRRRMASLQFEAC